MLVLGRGLNNSQVGLTTANFHVSRQAAVVILVVQVLVIAAVLASLTEVRDQPSSWPALAAGVKVATESKGSLLTDAKIQIFLSLLTASHSMCASNLQCLVQSGNEAPIRLQTFLHNVTIFRIEVSTFIKREEPCGRTTVISIQTIETLSALN